MEEPLVSICIPTYNSEQTIGRTVSSLIFQSYNNLELNIIDNKSTDDTIDIVKSLDDPRIKIYENEFHRPFAEGNWNRCFQYMNGKYSAIFHSDDIYKEFMIERQVNALENNQGTIAVFTGGEFINSKDQCIQKISVVDDYKYGKKLSQRDILISTLNNGNTLFTPSPLFISRVYKQIYPFRYDNFKYSSDLDMWLRAAGYGQIMVIDAPLLRYRISDTQGSSVIHKARTSEEAFFWTVDTYLNQYNDIPQESIDKYELRRLMDKLTCTKNSISQLGMRLPKMVLWGAMKKMGLN